MRLFRDSWSAIVVDDSMEPIDKLCFMEIEKQTDIQVHQTKVRKSLCLVDRVDGRLGFKLDDDQFFDQQIGAKRARVMQIIVVQGDGLLFDN